MNLKKTVGDVVAMNRLVEAGIAVHSGGTQVDVIQFAFRQPEAPVIMLWRESEVPSIEEANKIIEAARRVMVESYGIANPSSFFVRGANSVTLKKENGLWSYRRLTWTVGPTFFPHKGRDLDFVLKHAFSIDFRQSQ